MEVSVDYNMDEKVTIKPLNLDGRIVALTITRDGLEIKCKYYSGNEPKYDWFFEDELEHIKEKNVGFTE